MTKLEMDCLAFLDFHLPRRDVNSAIRKLLEEMEELQAALGRGAEAIESEAADVALCLVNLLAILGRSAHPCRDSLSDALSAKLDNLMDRAARGTWPKPTDPGRMSES